MSLKSIVIYLLVLSFCATICTSYFGLKTPDDFCFCKLGGRIDDCACNIDTVDHFNNVKIYPRLQSLLSNDYFRFYKVNLNRDCPFWSDESYCSLRSCHVEPCDIAQIPNGIREVYDNGYNQKAPSTIHSTLFNYIKYLFHTVTFFQFMNDRLPCDHDHNDELSYLNTTISAANYKEFQLWKEHDDAQDNFCVEQDDNGDAEYVDLTLNPERYTGYRGESAHRIWRSIYEENCFRPRHDITSSYIDTSNLNGMCLEKRAFYRVVSGLHASINIHLSAEYLLSEINKNLNFVAPKNQWGPNLEEFKRRFDPATTNGEGPQWLRNLYFVYLLELRALHKASPYLQHEEFYSGNQTADEEVRLMISDMLKLIGNFQNHFNENIMFNGGTQSKQLKEEFRQHFRNISRIMDCVGCEKCKLWGKLQTQGLGTALKILFSGKFEGINENGLQLDLSKNKFHLKRDEIVALLNAFGRLSTSIYQIEQFRRMFR